jgi:hypothetical protein
MRSAKSEAEIFLRAAKLFLNILNSVVSAASAYFVLVCANLGAEINERVTYKCIIYVTRQETKQV